MTKFDDLEFEKGNEAMAMAYEYSETARQKLESVRANYEASGKIEGSAEERDLKAQEIFNEYFSGPFQEFLSTEFADQDIPFQFAQLIDKHLDNIKKAGDDEQKLARKEMAEELTKKLNLIPVDKWTCSPTKALETKKANCSTLGALLMMMIESTKEASGIKGIEYVEPAGHIANLIHFKDGSSYFADPRNGNFVDMTNNLKIQEFDEFVVNENLAFRQEVPVRYLPSMKSFERGVAHIYVGNMYQVAEDEHEKEELARLITLIGSPIIDFKESEGYKNDSELLEGDHRNDT